MEEKNMNSGATKKPCVTSKRVIQVLSLVCMIVFFCPTFLVSCSGQSIKLSSAKIMVGIKSQSGYQVTEAVPVLILLLLIPIVIFVLTIIGKNVKQTSLGLLVLGIVDFVIWILLNNGVKKETTENYASYEILFLFYLNMICLGIIILLGGLLFIGKLSLETNILAYVTDSDNFKGMAVAPMGASGSSTTAGEEIAGFCMKCGNKVFFGNKFCSRCGNEMSDEFIQAAEKKLRDVENARREQEERERQERERSAKELEQNNSLNEIEADEKSATVENEIVNKMTEKKFCIGCGAKLDEDSVFCENCGKEVE